MKQDAADKYKNHNRVQRSGEQTRVRILKTDGAGSLWRRSSQSSDDPTSHTELASALLTQKSSE